MSNFVPFLIIEIGFSPVLFHLGPLAVHWYGVMYIIGIAAGLAVALPYASELGIDRDTAYGIFWPVLIASVIGGRLYYVVQSNLGWYLRHPSQILATWEGGMAFYGAVFLGGATAYVVCSFRGISFALVLDVAALFAPIAQTFGRIGNIINGDIIGYPSALPWATQYSSAANTFAASHSIAYQPAAAYELLLSLALFSILWRLRFRFHVPGTLFATWLLAYSAGQFVLFFVRANIIVLWGLKQAQLTAIVVSLMACPLYLVWRHYYLSHQGADASRLFAHRRDS